MKMKNWKKVGKLRWRNNRDFIQVYFANWFSQSKSYWIVGIGNLDIFREWKQRKFFKTKFQALKFARAYMRTLK